MVKKGLKGAVEFGLASFVLLACYYLDKDAENRKKWAKGLAALGWPLE